MLPPPPPLPELPPTSTVYNADLQRAPGKNTAPTAFSPLYSDSNRLSVKIIYNLFLIFFIYLTTEKSNKCCTT